VRRAFPQFSRSGYGLANLANHFGINFKHHDAVHDARTAGLILLKALEESGLDVEDWVGKSNQSTNLGSRSDFRRDGDGDGPLVGESLCFTGALQVPRSMAADMAHEAGAAVEAGVTKKTTILVVGDQDLAVLNGQDKSSKHRKAEHLIAAGQRLRILGEADFLSMCHS
jgi:DNA polymerase III subunit epsilon